MQSWSTSPSLLSSEMNSVHAFQNSSVNKNTINGDNQEISSPRMIGIKCSCRYSHCFSLCCLHTMHITVRAELMGSYSVIQFNLLFCAWPGAVYCLLFKTCSESKIINILTIFSQSAHHNSTQVLGRQVSLLALHLSDVQVCSSPPLQAGANRLEKLM